MVEVIKREFMFLVAEQGYVESVEALNYVLKDLIYSKGNMRVSFTCELMERAFDFEIQFRRDGKAHSVCEWAGRRRRPNAVMQSVFEYARGVWDEASFQAEKEALLHKKYGFHRAEKRLLDQVLLYKRLLTPAIRSIEAQLAATQEDN